jgi:hypothetical protein
MKRIDSSSCQGDERRDADRQDATFGQVADSFGKAPPALDSIAARRAREDGTAVLRGGRPAAQAALLGASARLLRFLAAGRLLDP